MMFKGRLYIQSTSIWTGHISRAQEPHVASGFMLNSTQTKRLTSSLQWVKASLAWLFMPLVFKSKELCLAIISWAWDPSLRDSHLSLHSTKNLSHPSICRTGLLPSQQKRYSSFIVPSLRHSLCNSLAPKLFQHPLDSHSLLSLSP